MSNRRYGAPRCRPAETLATRRRFHGREDLVHASKWALEGLSQSLAQEVAGFGVKVTLIEPSGYSTDWAGPSARHAAELPAYEPVREQAAHGRSLSLLRSR